MDKNRDQYCRDHGDFFSIKKGHDFRRENSGTKDIVGITT